MDVWFVCNLGGNFYYEPAENVGIVFTPKNGLSLGLVPEKFVGAADGKKCGCCGSERSCFRRATTEEIERWQKK